MKHLRHWLAILFTLAWFPAMAEEAAPVETFTLQNGLEVIVVQNHRIPAVSHTLWFRVGAGDDPRGKSGLAHFHEHAMFLGTKAYKAGEFDRIITLLGGKQNAFTSYDTTGYWVNIAKAHLPKVMELEADRFNALMPSDEAMVKEREVIIEERRARTENNPEALFSEQLNAALYLNHPYHWPIIGWKHEMELLSKQDVLDFHARYYYPNNAILILSGDITAAEAKPLVKKAYGKFPAGVMPERRWTAEPPQIAPRRVVMRHADVKQVSWTRSYLAPNLHDGDPMQAMPLFLFAQLLGGGKTSRLYQSLVVEQKLATSIDASYNGLVYGPGEFTVSAIPADGVSPEKLEAAIEAQLAAFLSGKIGDAELTRAKTLLKAETIYARDSLSGVGRLMGWIRILGLPVSFYNDWPKLIAQVTPEQILTSGKSVLDINRSVTGILLPEARK